MTKGIYATVALVLVALTQACAQGKQKSEITWSSVKGKNFNIYYYDRGSEVAQGTLEFFEAEFERVTQLVGYPPYFKTQIYLYNSEEDLQQRSVSSKKTFVTAEGEAALSKQHIEASIGTNNEFKEDLQVKFSSLILNEMMFGGYLKDAAKSDLQPLSEWFVNGAARYVAKGKTAEMDDYTNAFSQEKKKIDISKLSGRDATIAGQSFWNFIAEKHGKKKISDLLNYARITRNEEKSIQIVLGVNFIQAMNDWHNYYASK